MMGSRIMASTILADVEGTTFPDPMESAMWPVLFSNLLWLIVCGIYAALLFWQAGRDRKAGTGFVDDD